MAHMEALQEWEALFPRAEPNPPEAISEPSESLQPGSHPAIPTHSEPLQVVAGEPVKPATITGSSRYRRRSLLSRRNYPNHHAPRQ